jgi:hypothetical protein
VVETGSYAGWSLADVSMMSCKVRGKTQTRIVSVEVAGVHVCTESVEQTVDPFNTVLMASCASGRMLFSSQTHHRASSCACLKQPEK